MRRVLIIGIPALLTLAIALITYFNSIRRQYHLRIKEELTKDNDLESVEIANLPQQYLNYLKATNTYGVKINSFELQMSGEMKLKPEENFFKGKVTQKTFLRNGVRLFLMSLRYKGLKIYGIHDYNEYYSQMKIKILDMITVVNQKDDVMHRAETVTYLNDLCVFAPSALLYEDISFVEVDSHKITVTIKRHGNIVSADLIFDEEYKLINFISSDRAYYDDGKYLKAAWSTPIFEYRQQGNYYLPYKGSAIWTFEDSDFEYFKLTINTVTYK